MDGGRLREGFPQEAAIRAAIEKIQDKAHQTAALV
jgi:hypothetical protein